MKPVNLAFSVANWEAAAFGRLCVETKRPIIFLIPHFAAAFGRLCVETSILLDNKKFTLAAAFGRLCVETTGVSKL